MDPTAPTLRLTPPDEESWVVSVPDDGRLELWVTDGTSTVPIQRLGEVVLPPELRRDGFRVTMSFEGTMDPATRKVAGLSMKVVWMS